MTAYILVGMIPELDVLAALELCTRQQRTPAKY